MTAGPGAKGAGGARPPALVPLWLDRVAGLAWRALVVLVALVAVGYALLQVRLVVLPMIIAAFLTALLGPPVRWLERRGLPSLPATLLIYLVAVLVLVGLGFWIVPRFVDQLADLGASLTDAVDRLRSWLVEGPLGLSPEQVDDVVADVEDAVTSRREVIVSGAVTGVIYTFEALAVIGTSVLLSFFFVKDGDRITRALSGLVPERRRTEVRGAARRAWATLSGYLQGISIEALLEAVLTGVGLAVLGVPLALPLAVITFFAAYLPLVGALLAGSLAALVALVTVGPFTALLVIVLSLVIQNVASNLLDPLIMARTVHLHPAVVILAITFGGVVAGIIGAVVAVPLAGVVGALVGFYRDKGRLPRDGPPEVVPAPPESVSGRATADPRAPGGA